MNLFLLDQPIQLIAWLLAVVEFVLALYILLLNVWHTANRHVSALLFLTAINTFALGQLVGATDATQALWPTALLAATSFAVQPVIFSVTVVLLKPHWLRSRWRPLWWLVYGLALLPALVTVVDVGLGTGLWYTGLDARVYAGGFVPTAWYTGGRLSSPLRVVYQVLLPVLTLIFALTVAWRRREVSPLTRRLAWLLLVPQIVSSVAWFGLSDLLAGEVATLFTSTVYALVYGYVGFQQMISERRWQRGRLQTRLTVLILGVTVPLVIAMVTFVSTRAEELITQSAVQQLRATSQTMASTVSVWLDLNTQALQTLVSLPDVVTMDPELQKPLLEAMAAAYPHMHLVSTTDVTGLNVARSDELAFRNYRGRLWHVGARNGVPLTFEVMVDTGTGLPALVVGMPIKDETGSIVGVGMFATGLSDMADAVQAARFGETGFVYVVDGQNRVVAYPDPALSAELQDFGTYPPVSALREGTRGAMAFADEDGRQWRAYVDGLDNGWGIVAQQQETELLQVLRLFQRISWAALAVGAVLLGSVASLSIRQAFRPLGQLTETARAIAAGELERRAPVESEDEIGLLAETFNSMTEQLRVLIGTLEERVAERTRELERRSAYLEASAAVARAATSILEPDELIQQVVGSIRERFDLYYVGLFLVDQRGEWAVLRAGTGEAGRAMLARGHRIRVGAGMIGWSVAHAQARVALDVGEDAVRLATEELPDTRSEAALPLRSRERVLGALTVQSGREGAFDEATITVLQTMADQVAVALDNARLFAESQRALEATRRAYGEVSRQAWAELLRARGDWGYRYAGRGVAAAQGAWQPEMIEAAQTGQQVVAQEAGEPRLAIPIRVRDEVVGVLGFRKDGADERWTEEEVALLGALTEQVGVALESARLYQDTTRRAARERFTREITDKMRRAADVEAIVQTAVDELSEVLGSARTFARLGVVPYMPGDD